MEQNHNVVVEKKKKKNPELCRAVCFIQLQFIQTCSAARVRDKKDSRRRRESEIKKTKKNKSITENGE